MQIHIASTTQNSMLDIQTAELCQHSHSHIQHAQFKMYRTLYSLSLMYKAKEFSLHCTKVILPPPPPSPNTRTHTHTHTNACVHTQQLRVCIHTHTPTNVRTHTIPLVRLYLMLLITIDVLFYHLLCVDVQLVMDRCGTRGSSGCNTPNIGPGGGRNTSTWCHADAGLRRQATKYPWRCGARAQYMPTATQTHTRTCTHRHTHTHTHIL